MTIEIVTIVVASLVVVAVVALAVVVVRGSRAKNRDDDQLLMLARVGRDETLEARFSQLDSKLTALQESVASREAVLDHHVRDIGNQMQSISTLFTNDRARGSWGEVSMIRIFELGGLVEGRDYTAQFNAGDRTPDAVVHLPGGRDVVIDSKFPVARYNEALAAEDEGERQRLLVEQGKELERVGKSLIDKGYSELASGGYVVMYLPSQAVFEAAAASHPEIVDRLLALRVIVAGPTALHALLMNVGALLTEHRALEQADRIIEDARELHKRMTLFVGHLGSLGSALTKTVNVFNGAVGSYVSRVAPQLTRFNDRNGLDDPDVLTSIDERPREIGTEAYAPALEPSRN